MFSNHKITFMSWRLTSVVLMMFSALFLQGCQRTQEILFGGSQIEAASLSTSPVALLPPEPLALVAETSEKEVSADALLERFLKEKCPLIVGFSARDSNLLCLTKFSDSEFHIFNGKKIEIFIESIDENEEGKVKKVTFLVNFGEGKEALQSYEKAPT